MFQSQLWTPLRRCRPGSRPTMYVHCYRVSCTLTTLCMSRIKTTRYYYFTLWTTRSRPSIVRNMLLFLLLKYVARPDFITIDGGGGVDPSRGSRIFVYGVCRGDTSGMVLCYCTLQRYCVLLYYLYRNRWYSVGTVMNECDTYRYTIWIAFSSAYNVVVLATPPPRSRSIAYRGRSSRVRYLLCYIGTARRIIIMLCKHILYKKNVDSDGRSQKILI